MTNEQKCDIIYGQERGDIMYSILKRVEQYVRDFGMPYKKVLISSSYFPENFNRVMLEELNKELPLGKREDYIKIRCRPCHDCRRNPDAVDIGEYTASYKTELYLGFPLHTAHI